MYQLFPCYSELMRTLLHAYMYFYIPGRYGVYIIVEFITITSAYTKMYKTNTYTKGHYDYAQTDITHYDGLITSISLNLCK